MHRAVVIEELPLSYLSIFVLNVVAASILALGYSVGAEFVRDEFYLGGEDVVLLGANPGAVIAYGMSLQLLLDLMRTPLGQKSDRRLEQLGHDCITKLRGRMSIASGSGRNLLEGGVQSSERQVDWDRSWLEFIKLLVLRGSCYMAACLVGVGVIGLPTYFIYDGDNIESPSKVIDCDLFTTMGFLTEFSLFASAARGHNRRGVLLEAPPVEVGEESSFQLGGRGAGA